MRVVVLVRVVVVEVRVVVVGPGGMGLNPVSSTKIVVVVVVVVVVVDSQTFLATSPPQVVRNPPKTMRESSAASGSSKVAVIAVFARGWGRAGVKPFIGVRPVCRRHSGQTAQCLHLPFLDPKASLQSTSISGSYWCGGTGNCNGLPI